MPSWFTCNVSQAQIDTYQTTPVYTMVLADAAGSFGRTEFLLPDSAKREMLAIALAAISTQSKVSAFLDSPAGAPPWNCYTLAIVAG